MRTWAAATETAYARRAVASLSSLALSDVPLGARMPFEITELRELSAIQMFISREAAVEWLRGLDRERAGKAAASR